MTRYIWDVYAPGYTYYVDLVQNDPDSLGQGGGRDVDYVNTQDVFNSTLGISYIQAASSYTFDKDTGLYTLNNPATMGNKSNGYNYLEGIIIASWNLGGTSISYSHYFVLSRDRRTIYFARPKDIKMYMDQTYENPGDSVWWGITNSKLQLFWYDASDSHPQVNGRIHTGYLFGYSKAGEITEPDVHKEYKTTSTNIKPTVTGYSVKAVDSDVIQPSSITAAYHSGSKTNQIEILHNSTIKNVTGQKLTYHLERQVNGGSWTAVGTYSITYDNVNIYDIYDDVSSTWESVRYRVRITDGLGYTSDWVYSNTIEKTKYTVTVSASPSEGGTVSGGGQYFEEQVITLTAIPNKNWRFLYWIRTDPSVIKFAAPIITQEIKSNATYTAYFEREFRGHMYDGSGVAREVTKGYYFDSGGIARQIEKGYYFDSNGIAREIK